MGWQSRTVEGHTLFKFDRKQLALLQKDEHFVVVAKRLIRLEMKFKRVS